MNNTVKAVTSFIEAAWKPIVRSDKAFQFEDAYEVIAQWSNDVGELGIGFDDLENGVEWQKVNSDTLAYRIGGKALLVIEWDYDVDFDGDRNVATLTIHSWNMGTEAQQ